MPLSSLRAIYENSREIARRYLSRSLRTHGVRLRVEDGAAAFFFSRNIARSTKDFPRTVIAP